MVPRPPAANPPTVPCGGSIGATANLREAVGLYLENGRELQSPQGMTAEFGARALHSDESKPWVKPSQIERIARDNRIVCSLGADHHVSVGDVRRTRLREQRANGLCASSVERRHFGFVKLDHSP